MANKTTINLCNVPIRYTHQLNFADGGANAQQEYFDSKVIKTYNNCRYIPRTDKIKIIGYADSEVIRTANYGFYENEYKGENKRYYFWIVNRRFMAFNTVELTIQLDVYQTWYYEMEWNETFVERITVDDDRIGLHTYPEDFEIGEYHSRKTYSESRLKSDTGYILVVSDIPKGSKVMGGSIANTITSCDYIYFDSPNALNSRISDYDKAGKSDSIVCIFQIPKDFFTPVLVLKDGLTLNSSIIQNGVSNWTKIQGTISNELTLPNMKKDFYSPLTHQFYYPKNNKLLTYPYNFLEVSTSTGNQAVLKYELFYDMENIKFKNETVLLPNASFTTTPCDYANDVLAYADSVQLDGWGLCQYNNDTYANWYAQNKNTINATSENARRNYNSANTIARNNYVTGGINNSLNYARGVHNAQADYNQSMINTGINTVGSLLNLNFGGALSSALSGGINANLNRNKSLYNNKIDDNINRNNLKNDLSNSNLINSTDYANTINSLMASVQDASCRPNMAKGETNGDIDNARKTRTFYYRQKMIDSNYAQAIDLYFQRYGYKVNKIMNFSVNNRVNWDYIKTVDIKILGDVPPEDKEEIENLFDGGFTIWHNEHYMYRYNRDNPIKKKIIN